MSAFFRTVKSFTTTIGGSSYRATSNGEHVHLQERAIESRAWRNLKTMTQTAFDAAEHTDLLTQLRKTTHSVHMLGGESLEGASTPVDACSEDYTQALAASDIDAVRLLIARTPDVNAVRFFAGLTVLHVACRCYHLAANGPQERRARAEAIVQLLLDAGADPMAVDRTGQMPAAWGSTPALRARMLELAEAQCFPPGASDFARLGSSTSQDLKSANRFDPGLSYSCAFIPVGQVAWASREWRA